MSLYIPVKFTCVFPFPSLSWSLSEEGSVLHHGRWQKKALCLHHGHRQKEAQYLHHDSHWCCFVEQKDEIVDLWSRIVSATKDRFRYIVKTIRGRTTRFYPGDRFRTRIRSARIGIRADRKRYIWHPYVWHSKADKIMYTKMSWPAQMYSIPCTRNPFHLHKTDSREETHSMMHTQPIPWTQKTFHVYKSHSMHTKPIPWCTRNPFHAHKSHSMHVHKSHSMHSKAIPCTQKPFHVQITFHIHVRTYIHRILSMYVHKNHSKLIPWTDPFPCVWLDWKSMNTRAP